MNSYSPSKFGLLRLVETLGLNGGAVHHPLLCCVIYHTSAAPASATLCPSDKVGCGESARRDCLARNMHINEPCALISFSKHVRRTCSILRRPRPTLIYVTLSSSHVFCCKPPATTSLDHVVCIAPGIHRARSLGGPRALQQARVDFLSSNMASLVRQMVFGHGARVRMAPTIMSRSVREQDDSSSKQYEYVLLQSVGACLDQ